MKTLKFTALNLIFLCLLSCGSTSKVNSQKTIVESNSKYIKEGSFKQVKLDKLGNIYLINEKNNLIKFNESNNETFNYAIKRYGDISSIDVSNPHKILLYYGDFRTAVILDNTLSEIKIIFLEELNIWDVQAIGMSNDNLLWIFDNLQKQIIKINFKGEEQLSSNPMFENELVSNAVLTIQEANQKVFLNTGDGLITFDNFGQYISSIPEIKTHNFQVINDQIIYLDQEHQLLIYRGALEGSIHLLENKNQHHCRSFYIFEEDAYFIDMNGLMKENLN